MKDQEARDRISRLEKRLEFYEYERMIEVCTSEILVAYEEVSIRQVVELVLEHLGMELEYTPYVQSEVALRPLDTKEEED